MVKFKNPYTAKWSYQYVDKLVIPDGKQDDQQVTPRCKEYKKNMDPEILNLLVDKYPNAYQNATSTYKFETYEENEPVSIYSRKFIIFICI